jgi:O-antigen/teichoic acid export membrane protein
MGFEMNGLTHKIAFNTLIQIAAKILITAINLVTTALLTRYLGPASYGDYLIAIGFITIFNTSADWGTTLITVREASQNQHHQSQIIGNSFILRNTLALVSLLAALLVAVNSPYNQSLKLLTLIASFAIISLSLKTSFYIIFQVKLKFQNWAASEITSAAANLFLCSFFIVSRLPLVFFILALIVSHSLAAVTAALLSRRLISLNLSPSSKILKRLFQECLPMGAILFLYSLYITVDKFILRALGYTAAVGLYGLAYRIRDVSVQPAAYFMNTLLPILSAKAKVNFYSDFKIFYQKALDILIIMGLGLFLFFFLFSHPIFLLLGGSKFAVSSQTLRLISFSIFISFLNHLTGYSLISLGKQTAALKINLFTVFLNIFLNLILIPRFSYLAAIFNLTLTEFLNFIFTSFIIYQKTQIIPSFVSFPKTALLLFQKYAKITKFFNLKLK